MVEFVGLIKVNIVKGSNLAVRDMMSSHSDPYVILTLGSQVSFLVFFSVKLYSKFIRAELKGLLELMNLLFVFCSQ